jgi:tetratricopeptide (TPR) repeat protein
VGALEGVSAVGRGRPVDQQPWPAEGPHRELLKFLSTVRADNGMKSLRKVAHAMMLSSPTRVHRLLCGAGGALPADENQLKSLVRALGGGDDEISRGLKLYQLALRAVHSNQARRTATVRALDQWDPFALDVHPAITMNAASELPSLSAYIRRPHDDEIDQLLHDISSSSMIVITGGSSTGKTRAMYEALRGHSVLREWPLHYPRTAASLLRLLTGGQLEGSTVLWLNDAHQFLDGPLGEDIAAALHQLMDGSIPGPVVVLGSIWQDVWEMIASQPEAGTPDEHFQARQLLFHATHRVRIVGFTDEQWKALTYEKSVDARVALAARTARNAREVIQVLTGGPLLIDRLEHPESDHALYASAVVTAALDIRRLGHYSAIPRSLLINAASIFLDSDRCEAEPAENWPDVGLQKAVKRVHGIRALNPHRTSDHTGSAGYHPHDYLDQHAHRTRRTAPVQEALWLLLIDQTYEVEDLQRLAHSAEMRLQSNAAEGFLERLIQAGQEWAISKLYNMLDEQGRAYEAIDLLQRETAAGNWDALHHLADLLANQGRVDEAIDLLTNRLAALDPSEVDQLARPSEDEPFGKYIISAARGPGFAFYQLANLLADHGEPEKAIDMLRFQVRPEEGDMATWRLDEILTRLGRTDEVIELWRQHLEYDDYAVHRVTDLLLESHRENEAMELLHTRSEAGSTGATKRLGELLISQERVGETVGLWRSQVESGNSYAVDWLADLLVRLGSVDDAIELLRSERDNGHPSAGRRLAELLADQGDIDEAISAWYQQIQTDPVPGLIWPSKEKRDDRAVVGLANLFIKLDRIEDAIDLLCRYNEGGSNPALESLAEVLVGLGRIDEAVSIVQDEVNAGRPGAGAVLRWLLDYEDR